VLVLPLTTDLQKISSIAMHTPVQMNA